MSGFLSSVFPFKIHIINYVTSLIRDGIKE